MITITGADRVAALLARDLTAPIQAGLTAIAAEVQNVLAVYPPPSRAAQEFKSDKSRRYFFAALRSGRITVPYRRSGDLGRAWKTIPLGPYRVQLVNTQRYAGLVHGTPQAGYHAGTWTSEGAAVAEVRPRAPGIMEDAIKGGLGL